MFDEPFNITTYSFQHMENNFHKTERALDEGELHRREAGGERKADGRYARLAARTRPQLANSVPVELSRPVNLTLEVPAICSSGSGHFPIPAKYFTNCRETSFESSILDGRNNAEKFPLLITR